MSAPGSITQLAWAAKDGDSAAANQIWALYAERLLTLARRKLSHRVRRREDEEDVIQMVFASFFHRAREGRFNLRNRDELWNLLLTITLRKVRNTAKRHARACRNYRREARLSLPEASSIPAPVGKDASTFVAEFERLLCALSKPDLVVVVRLKFDGLTNLEIAGVLDVTERTVERKLRRIRSEWTRMAEES